jgi:hypothetical protein
MRNTFYKPLLTFLITALLVFGITWWYRSLSPRQKQFIQNLLKQVPDLPMRYMV